jgi:DNA topoisomerase-1
MQRIRTMPPGTPPTADVWESVACRDLRYVNDSEPGITRQRRDKDFIYRYPSGALVRDSAVLARIRALAIPPAYDAVWICVDERGHLQATGRDSRGRKQYRYHPLWQAERSAVKFDRLIILGGILPTLRAAIDRDLALPGLPRRKVLALIVRLLEQSRIRVGNDEYRRANGSFGLTTLRDRHARVDGSRIEFRFRGKRGKQHRIQVIDRRLARLVRRCQDIPGQDLFQYIDEHGKAHTLGSTDVNAYLADLTDHEVTAKDFRTWAGSVLAIRVCRDCLAETGQHDGSNLLARVVTAVAQELGNTPAVARGSYIHPAVLDAIAAGALDDLDEPPPDDAHAGLDENERVLLSLLGALASTTAPTATERKRLVS